MQKKREVPSDFDYHLLAKVISITLDKSDHCVVIVKLLLLLYNNILTFPKYVVARIAMMLMKEKFIFLFCHWSHLVRYVFHHLIWFRFYHTFCELEVFLHDIL